MLKQVQHDGKRTFRISSYADTNSRSGMLNPEKRVQGRLVSAGPARFWRPCGQTKLLFMTLTSKTVMLNLFQHPFLKHKVFNRFNVHKNRTNQNLSKC
jgi:hypothetical protein